MVQRCRGMLTGAWIWHRAEAEAEAKRQAAEAAEHQRREEERLARAAAERRRLEAEAAARRREQQIQRNRVCIPAKSNLSGNIDNVLLALLPAAARG